MVSVVGDSHGSSGQNTSSGSMGGKMPPLIRDLLTSIDDKEWQHSLFSLLQNQTYNQCEVDLFELLCKVLDQNLFAQVDWARNSIFFKDLKVSLKSSKFTSFPMHHFPISFTHFHYQNDLYTEGIKININFIY